MYKYLIILVIFFTILSCKNREVSAQDVQEPEKVVVVEKAEIEDVIINPLLKEHLKWVIQDVECECGKDYYYFSIHFLKEKNENMLYIVNDIRPPISIKYPSLNIEGMISTEGLIGFKDYKDNCFVFYSTIENDILESFIDTTKLNTDVMYIFNLREENINIYDSNMYISKILSPERLIFLEKRIY